MFIFKRSKYSHFLREKNINRTSRRGWGKWRKKMLIIGNGHLEFYLSTIEKKPDVQELDSFISNYGHKEPSCQLASPTSQPQKIGRLGSMLPAEEAAS